MECRQYDSEANLLLKFNLSIDNYVDNPKNTFLETYNLQNGGMVLLFKIYVISNFNKPKVEKMKILYVREDGQQTLPPIDLDLKNSYILSKLSYYIFEDDEEFCLKFFIQHRPSLNFDEVNIDVDYRVDCIQKNYFYNLTSGNVKL